MKVPETIPRLNLLALNIPAEMKSTMDEIQRVDDAQNRMLGTVARAINGRIEFGNPTGEETNIRGAWVEASFTATNTATPCTHNLGVPIPGAPVTEPNVRWLVFGMQHDGTGTLDSTSTLSVNYHIGDTITADAINLRLYSTSARTIDGDHPVTVTLFFVPAVSTT